MSSNSTKWLFNIPTKFRYVFFNEGRHGKRDRCTQYMILHQVLQSEIAATEDRCSSRYQRDMKAKEDEYMTQISVLNIHFLSCLKL